jgi:ankyrin repeat protein
MAESLISAAAKQGDLMAVRKGISGNNVNAIVDVQGRTALHAAAAASQLAVMEYLLKQVRTHSRHSVWN